MNWKWAFAGAITLVIGSWNIGQAGERPVIRAQGGVYHDPHPVHHEPYPVHHHHGVHEGHDDCGPLYRCWTYITTLGGRPGAHFGYGAGYGAGGEVQYMYRYRAPQNLVYPAANQPAGVVVYPYYTVKGPDDFFLN